MSRLALLVVAVSVASPAPAEGFFFGILEGFFQPFPLAVPTFVDRTQVGGIYINAFPFTTPPAADCFTRALGLLNGCQPFLMALNANGGQLSFFSVFQILALAKNNITGDLTCYNAAASFLNGVSNLSPLAYCLSKKAEAMASLDRSAALWGQGCICDNGLISTINILTTVPAVAKSALTSLNRAKCPPSPPPPPVAPAVPFSVGGPPPAFVPPPMFVPPTATTPSPVAAVASGTMGAVAPRVVINVPALAPAAGRHLLEKETLLHADRVVSRRSMLEDEGPHADRVVW